VRLVSSIPAYATPGSAATDATARTRANFFVAAVILGLFVLSAVFSAERKDVTRGFDEVAHASYVAHIQRTGTAWPRLEAMRLLDPKSFEFAGEGNYINHPPLFYDVLAALGPRLEGHPGALLVDRLIDVAIAALGFAALLGLGLAARLPRNEFYAYAVPLACIPVLVPIAGSVDNDNLAFLGGAVATLGIWRLAAGSPPGLSGAGERAGAAFWLTLALAGVVVCAWAKLTGLLLTGTMVGAAIVYLMWRRQLPWSWLLVAAFGFAVAATPYIIFLIQYGSPTPDTPAQTALLVDGARAAGWADLPRKSFGGYVAYFIVAFIADWMPTLGARSMFNYAMLVIPIAVLGCALGGGILSARRLWHRQETALDIVVIAGALALGATFMIHVNFSYGRHLATGWLMDAYPRYYLPLAAIVPLAALSLYGAINAPRWRAALLGFLVAGPILFRIFGAPLAF
jgi:hypothetical protein